MRVLQIAPRVCWPLDTGAKLRNYHLARVLSKHAAVSLLAFTDGTASSDGLGSYDDVIVIPRDRGYTPAKILRGGLGKTPLPLEGSGAGPLEPPPATATAGEPNVNGAEGCEPMYCE